MTASYIVPHREAMDAMDEADRAIRGDDTAAAHNAMRRALFLETRAAQTVPASLEPTRSVLFRSAASIAARLGDSLTTKRLAINGLRGAPPREVKAELFELLDSLAPPPATPGSAVIIQQLRMRSASPKGGPLPIPALTAVQNAWLETIEQLTPEMSDAVFLDAGPGSYVVRFEFRGAQKHHPQLLAALNELRNVSEFVASSRLRQGTDNENRQHFRSVQRVLSLLACLAEGGIILDVATDTEAGPQESFELRAPLPEDLKVWQETIAASVLSGDIPQADDLAKVVRFVELLEDGRYPTPATLEVGARQINYYRRAAEILGFLRNKQLTPSGQLLVRLDGIDRWRHVLEHVTTSDIGSAWIVWSGQANFLDVSRSTATDFLLETAVGLSEITARRRALTLSAWHEKLDAETSAEQ